MRNNNKKFHRLAFPLGHVPVLEIDGKKMSHSTSICRFLAKKVGLAGSNDMEDFEIDSVIDTINDFRTSKVKENCDCVTSNLYLLLSRNFDREI